MKEELEDVKRQLGAEVDSEWHCVLETKGAHLRAEARGSSIFWRCRCERRWELMNVS